MHQTEYFEIIWSDKLADGWLSCANSWEQWKLPQKTPSGRHSHQELLDYRHWDSSAPNSQKEQCTCIFLLQHGTYSIWRWLNFGVPFASNLIKTTELCVCPGITPANVWGTKVCHNQWPAVWWSSSLGHSINWYWNNYEDIKIRKWALDMNLIIR